MIQQIMKIFNNRTLFKNQNNFIPTKGQFDYKLFSFTAVLKRSSTKYKTSKLRLNNFLLYFFNKFLKCFSIFKVIQKALKKLSLRMILKYFQMRQKRDWCQ